MPRVIRWFDQTEDFLCGEKFLPDIPVVELKKIYPDSWNDPYLYDCYRITKKEANFFKQYVDIEFEFDKYEYFSEIDADKE
jgi:hypothetical protein